MEVTYTRAKVPNSFSRRMKLLCNTLTEHDKPWATWQHYNHQLVRFINDKTGYSKNDKTGYSEIGRSFHQLTP